LRHLFVAGELLGLRLLSLHNVRYLIRLAGEMRAVIQRGGDAFASWADDWRRRYQHTGVA
jgi:queuine tRNA-ribosyltransferase